MNTFIITLLSTLKGPSGKSSTIRAMAFIIVLSVVGTWAIVSLAKLELQPISPEMVMLVASAFAGKVGQRAVENKPANR